PFAINTEGNHTVSFFSGDKAGNFEKLQTKSVNVDQTSPQTTAVANPLPNTSGWNNTNVTVTLSATDNQSGVDPTESNLNRAGWTPVSGPGAISTQGVHALQYRSVDKASNVESAQQLAVRIDKTSPVVSVTGASQGASYALGNVPTAACNTTDALSGVATPAS